MRYRVLIEAELVINAENESQAADLAIKAARSGGVEVQALYAIPIRPIEEAIALPISQRVDRIADHYGICLADWD